MNSYASKRRALMILLAVIAAVCLAVALAISLPTERAFAQGDNDEGSAERTPVVTYVIGDDAVTDENGFTYDEATNTYTYADHAAGWSAAIAASYALHNEVSDSNPDANLVKVLLASTWNANAPLLCQVSRNILLDLNGFDVDRGLTSGVKNGFVVNVQGGKLEVTDTSIDSCGKITGGYLDGANGAGILMSGTAEVIMSGGSITGNTASNGGGVRVNGGTFIMNGGSITKNFGSATGGAMYVSGATAKAIINGGTISGNFTSGQGGAIYNKQGTLELSGGTITNNGAASIGAGVYLSTNSITTLSGTICIHDNYHATSFSEDGYTSGTANNFVVSTQGKLNINRMQSGANVKFANLNNPFTTDGYAENNTDENGIVTDPSEYFAADNDNYKVILNSDGEVQFTDKGALAWTVTSEKDTDIEKSAYGAAIIYSENSITGISLTQNNGPVSGITVTDSNGNTISDLAASPLTNAGTYYATATVKGVGTDTVQTKFTVVILPYNIEGKTTYTVTATGWTEEEEQYIARYDGINKTLPTLSVELNNAGFDSSNYAVTYELNGATVSELKEVGEYTVAITGTGNYCGTVYASERFVITQNTDQSYTVTWQYYDGESWQDLSSLSGAAFTYTSADYSGLVRIVLSVENVEIRYAYASGVTEYNLAEGEEEANVTHGLSVGIAKGEETVIKNAGEYNLTLNGTPNYAVAEAEKTNNVSVAKYNLANIVNGSADTAKINAALDNTAYNAQEKTLTLSASVTLSGNAVTLGTDGAEYTYVIKYINADGSETEVEAFILGGTYKIYLAATGENLTDTLGIVGTVTINRTNNSVTLNGTGNWEYGTYNIRIHGITGSATYLYDGTLAGTEQAYVYYTVNNTAGEAASETLTRFTSLTDDVVKALNALNAGSYTLVAEVDETASYEGATSTSNFAIVKATNSFVVEPNVVEWQWNDYDLSANPLVLASVYGNDTAIKTVKDSNGNIVDGLANFTDVTDEIVAKLKGLNAGDYTVTVVVAETNNYSGLEETVGFTVAKAQNAWTTNPHLTRWVAGYYDADKTYITGEAKYGDMTYQITDANGNVITDLAAMEVGEYTLTMTVAGTDNYEGLTYTETFQVFESRDLKGGEIAGITIASIVVAGLAAAVIVLLIKRRKTV